MNEINFIVAGDCSLSRTVSGRRVAGCIAGSRSRLLRTRWPSEFLYCSSRASTVPQMTGLVVAELSRHEPVWRGMLWGSGLDDGLEDLFLRRGTG